MTTRDALVQFLEESGMRPKGDPSPEIYPDDWFRLPIGSRRIPLFKHGAIKQSLMLHDLHHVLTGYGTDLRGEIELAGWELGSGGCGTRAFMWLDRLGVAFLALFAAPRSFFRACRVGRACRNLYRDDLDELLVLDPADLRRRAGLERDAG